MQRNATESNAMWCGMVRYMLYIYVYIYVYIYMYIYIYVCTLNPCNYMRWRVHRHVFCHLIFFGHWLSEKTIPTTSWHVFWHVYWHVFRHLGMLTDTCTDKDFDTYTDIIYIFNMIIFIIYIYPAMTYCVTTYPHWSQWRGDMRWQRWGSWSDIDFDPQKRKCCIPVAALWRRFMYIYI